MGLRDFRVELQEKIFRQLGNATKEDVVLIHGLNGPMTKEELRDFVEGRMSEVKMRTFLKERPLNDYLALRYPMIIEPNASGGYVALFPDIPGCHASGSTPQEAAERLDTERKKWIISSFDSMGQIPEPTESPLPLGRYQA